MKNILLLAALLALCACISTDPENLAKMDDKGICQVAKLYPMDVGVINELRLRKLPCHPAEQMCTSAKKNQKLYNKCLEGAFAQLQADELQSQASGMAIGNAFSQYGQTRYAPDVGQINTRTPTQTNCNKTQFGMNCTSY